MTTPIRPPELYPEDSFMDHPHDDREDDWDDPDSELDDALDECGLTTAGFCLLAGTEHCDWDCPFSR